jgi:hypothetical protein
MWNEILDALERHDDAVLTGYDEEGFPFSVRCVPSADWRNRRLIVGVPASSGIQPGRASILMHSHNEELWDLVQFLIRGTLVKTKEGYYFVPANINGSPRPAAGLDPLRTMKRIRDRGNAYLNKRGIPRPKVPWDDIKRLQERARQRREEMAREHRS